MADIFGGIFDSISSLFDDDAITNAIGRGGLAAFGSDKSSSQTSLSELTRGMMEMGVNNNFNSTKTGAVESVSPDNYENVWKARLKKFAEIESDTGVKVK